MVGGAALQEHVVADDATKAGGEYERQGGDDAETYAGNAKERYDVRRGTRALHSLSGCLAGGQASTYVISASVTACTTPACKQIPGRQEVQDGGVYYTAISSDGTLTMST